MTRRRPVPAALLLVLAAGAVAPGCTFALWDRAPPDRNVDSAVVVRDEEEGLFSGLFTRQPPDLPDAVPVPQLRSAELEPAVGGMILRVTGVAPTQGFFNAALVPDGDGAPDAAGVVTVRLVAVPPETPELVGPERTRLLMTAAFIDRLNLRDIRAFRVVAGQNAVTLPIPRAPGA
jgi:hypothetical protein